LIFFLGGGGGGGGIKKNWIKALSSRQRNHAKNTRANVHNYGQ